MMKKTQTKDALRNIRKYFVSYLAVAIVTMIGCGVYFGAFFYADALVRSGQEFFRDTNFEDMDVIAVRGLSADEIREIASIDGIQDAEGTYQITGATAIYAGEDYDVTVFGATDRVGESVILSGTYPSKEGECALPKDAMKEMGVKIGSTIQLMVPSAMEGLLKTDTYTVTAEIMHPEDYRTGSVNYVILSKESFDQEFVEGNYTFVRVKAGIPKDTDILSSAYFTALQPIKEALDEGLKEIAAKQNRDRKARAEAVLSEEEKKANDQIREAEQSLAEKEQELEEAEAQIAEGEAQIAEAEKQLEDAKNAVNSRAGMVSKMEGLLHLPIPGASSKLGSAKAQIEENEALLEEKKAEIAEAKEQAEDGRKQLDDAKAELEEKKAEAEKKIADARDEIDAMEPAVFAVLTRNEKEGYVALDQIVNILKKLASVFVVIFMAIGVIVVLSTITILIDNQKKLIGSMKAFGFRNSEIILKYAIFGVSAVFLGMLMSIVLAILLEQVIAIALGGIFVVEPQKVFFRIGDFLLLLLIELLLAGFVAVAATYLNAVRSSAVDLMNGVTKEKGFHFTVKKGTGKSLYSRLIFRNMRKDAARVICSVIIIAGSCLMIGVGFTMDLAFRKLTVKSVEQVTHYDLEITIPNGTSEDTIEKLKEMLKNEELPFAEMYSAQTRFIHDDKEEFVRVISGDNAYIGDYLIFSDMEGKSRYPLDAQRVLVPVRLRESFDIKPGDEIIFYDTDMKQHKSTAGETIRNYIGRNIYLSEDVYRNIFGEDGEKNLLLVRTGDRAKEEVIQEIRQAFPRMTVERTDTLPDAVSGFWTRVFRTLIAVMTGLSILMSVFVLLNLVNIFVGRRKNELIIMAVNGFSYRQRIGYLLRETIATTALGLLLGTGGGCLLTNYLVRIIEPTDAMFDRSIQPLAWLIACGMEAVFALLINFFAFRRVKGYQLTDLTRS